MPAGQVIGRVSVKVLPDTDDFRRAAQRDLDRIEKTLKLTVATTVDMSGASREYLEELRKINARNRTTDSRKIRFNTIISTDGMNDAVRKAVLQLNARAKDKKVKFTVDDLEAKGEVKLELDDQSADDTKHKIEHWARSISPIKIKVEPDFSAIGGRITAARLAVLTRPRTVSIIPTLDSAAVTKLATALAALSGARVLNNIFTRLSDTLRNLDKSVPIIGTLSLAIAGLAGWGLSAASNLFALSSSLAQIGPAALLLPGLFGGLATGIGVMIAAFRDFNTVLPEVKDALHGLQDTISKNFWDKAAEPIRTMVDELLPEFTAGVAQTATQLGGFFAGLATGLKGALNPALNQMFVDLSSSIDIATSGTGALANIIAVLGKVGTSYLPSLAQWFVNVTTEFSNFLSKAETDGALKGWIDVGIQNLKDLGTVLSNLGGIFAGLSRAATAGGGSTLASLGVALKDIHTTVDSPGFQTGMADTFLAAHKAMSLIANESGPAVKNLLTTLAELLQSVLPQVGRVIGTALGAVAQALSQPAVVNGIHAVFDGIEVAVQALAPAMMPLGKALGALLQVIGTFATMLGPLVSATLIPLAGIFAQLAPAIQPFITLLGGALTSAITAIAPIVTQLGTVLTGILGGAFKSLSGSMPGISDAFGQLLAAVGPLAQALGGALATILPPLAQIFGQLVAAVLPLATALATALTPILTVLAQALKVVLTALMPIIAVVLQIVTAVIGPLLPMLSQLVTALLPPLAAAIARVLAAIQPILNVLLVIVQVLMAVLVPVLSFIIGILSDALVGAVNGVALVFEGLVEVFQGVWNTIKGIFEIFWGLFEGIFTGNWDTFKQGFSDLWNGILGFLKGIWDTILGALVTWLNVSILKAAGVGIKAIGELWKVGWTALKAAGEAVWTAIGGSFTGFGNVLKGIGTTMMSGLKTLIKSGWTAIQDACSTAWTAIKTAISTGVTNAITVVKELPSKALTALSNLGSILVSAGKSLISGFINGITSMFGAVKGKLKELTGKLTSWKGPESLDKVLLVDAGVLVINGFINGLESRYDAVRKSLRGLTEDVAGTEFEVPGVNAIRAASSAASALAGAVGSAASEGGVTKVLNYYAAPGSSISSEEDLFAAANRARMGW